MGLFRRDRAPDPPPAPPDPLSAVDRGAVPARLLPVVDRALSCAHRYRALVADRPPGPVRDRMAALGHHVDAGVLAVHETARRAARLDAVAGTLDVERATAAYKDARRRDADPDLVEVHRQRFESVQRVLNARDDVDGRLEVLEARLEAAVARAAELSVGPGTDLGAVEADVGAVADELAALQAGLDELSGPGGAA
ncbi:hypothetical protein PO878_18225 [Iamia majanohamensis]|uniref:Uncharacterized protein n=1 Tax=Iamia majanohamensis TaxID=467976 RepID=A0AAE9Y8I6_9ACTN|nr:hypothetical protein [Iamia majanohamensis]WCO66438.1 hypothetical protein PO878_18225 [Iamia majanohamensis]